ncbi:expressed protein [Dictyostelium purpureum]|uniref:Expressed protein n=1 Tax=Dictyostelium purpureum TaxID=5786 RepID=F0ZRF6_DICPU|nr:uncharacterized protein DICPUDRAFT_92398 [Dictyostelium purpureum]EGC33473.1 expressed protein [Dictyostelium purpureum]|eukprot:XP_003289996.1 expressed protein [Dictyostelium purpureum]
MKLLLLIFLLLNLLIVSQTAEAEVNYGINENELYKHRDPLAYYCKDDSCPHKYCCVQLRKSYTCVLEEKEPICHYGPLLKNFY